MPREVLERKRSLESKFRLFSDVFCESYSGKCIRRSLRIAAGALDDLLGAGLTGSKKFGNKM